MAATHRPPDFQLETAMPPRVPLEMSEDSFWLLQLGKVSGEERGEGDPAGSQVRDTTQHSGCPGRPPPQKRIRPRVPQWCYGTEGGSQSRWARPFRCQLEVGGFLQSSQTCWQVWVEHSLQILDQHPSSCARMLYRHGHSHTESP